MSSQCPRCGQSDETVPVTYDGPPPGVRAHCLACGRVVPFFGAARPPQAPALENHDCYPTGGRCHSHDKPLIFCEDHRSVASDLRAALREIRVLLPPLSESFRRFADRQFTDLTEKIYAVLDRVLHAEPRHRAASVEAAQAAQAEEVTARALRATVAELERELDIAARHAVLQGEAITKLQAEVLRLREELNEQRVHMRGEP